MAISRDQGPLKYITTSASFTASAKALAQKGDVKLIDGKTLKMGTFDYEPSPGCALRAAFNLRHTMRRLLRRAEVLAKTSFKDSDLDKRITRGEFPRPAKGR